MELCTGGDIGDALAALFRGKGIEEQMRRADQALVHSGGGLDGQQLIHQGFVNSAAKLRQRFGQDKVILRTLELNFSEVTGILDCRVGAQPLAEGFVRSAHPALEALQS